MSDDLERLYEAVEYWNKCFADWKNVCLKAKVDSDIYGAALDRFSQAEIRLREIFLEIRKENR